MGRNRERLKELAESHERVEAVQITGDVEVDTKSLQSFGSTNAYFDISPREAANSTHFRSCILALSHSGRMCFMGSVGGELVIPLSVFVRRDLQLKGKWMYTRQIVRNLIKMIEVGMLKLGGQKVDQFALEDWEKAFNAAEEYAGTDGAAVIVP
ncbi:putative isopropanol dehydrogenase [Phaeomoniella chlamydospora]|uniref:Putative isopropanol dehydrogenase n=1 Tax=Phaeomoniella chlamydospora TaxID=158046 RepID=A0A0G2E2W1_PHACM|nr:putative isopropanol dehydrogenase [Phaeomoniella chlamydospora]